MTTTGRGLQTDPIDDASFRPPAVDPVAGPGKREVDLYVRTYTTLLQSSGAIGVSSLEPAHLTAAPSLHAGAAEPAPDMNAFAYSIQRLPACIPDVRQIVLGQSAQAFARAGFRDLAHWTTQSAPGRRRKWLYDGRETLAAYIASASDLDDLIPTIVAYQIEWNKIHRLIRADPDLAEVIHAVASATSPDALPWGERLTWIGERLLLTPNDWARLRAIWGTATWTNLGKIATERKRYSLRMLGGSYIGYNRSTRHWWSPVAHLLTEKHLHDREVYFISSNTHSIVNVLSGTVRRRKVALADSIRRANHPELIPELDALESGRSRSSWDNLLYFAARHHFAAPGMEQERRRRSAEEEERGIYHVEGRGALDVGIQIIDLAKLDPASFDPRLCGPDERLDPEATDAIVVNINYPLGLAAYHIMTQIAMTTDQLRGVYILGKAATLNGRIGDVMIASVVFDEHSGNTYWFDNCFSYDDLSPFLVYGAALDNQKAVTVKGTYLQNQGYLDFFYRENFTVIEMEAGPFLSAIYEDLSLRRYPAGEAVNLMQSSNQIDLGIIHYASDTPYTRAQTLGARGMSYYGLDSTYASTIAILRRVFTQSGILRAAADR
ncbi:MAG TPA: hypothetical protein VKB09_08105 [Thermomicrobiales bacterium]|nr:hypothetical protein [Thermomicrobiales bacterium]